MFFKHHQNRSKKSKYWAKKIEIDGIIFASGLEARFYKYFRDFDIKILELQPRFLLEDAFEIFDWNTGKMQKYRKTEYVADFRIETKSWDIFIVEAKGFETEAWKLKKKLFLKKYGHTEKLVIAKSIRELEKIIF